MTPPLKFALYILLATVGLSLQVLAHTTSHDMRLNLTRSDIICVGQLKESLLFITTDPFVYEFPVSALNPSLTILDTSKAKGNLRLQDKWPQLYSRWYNDTIANSITVHDSSNRSFLFMMLYPQSYRDWHIFGFFDLDNHQSTFQQFDSSFDFNNKIWISSDNLGELYMLRTEPTYALAKYEFSNAETVNASTGLTIDESNGFLTLCVNVTQVFFIEDDNCTDEDYQPIGPRPYSNWQISRGFATKDRFYLFGKENVYSFPLDAFKKDDEDNDDHGPVVTFTKVPKELFTIDENPSTEPTSPETPTIDEYVYLTGKPSYDCKHKKTVFEEYHIWWILCLISLADLIIMSLWYCWLYRFWYYSCCLAWFNIKERNDTNSNLYGEEDKQQNYMEQGSTPVLPVLPAPKDVTRTNQPQHIIMIKANDSAAMSKPITPLVKNSLTIASKGKAANGNGSKGKTVASVAKCKTYNNSTTKDNSSVNAPVKGKKVRTVLKNKDQTSPVITCKVKTRCKPSSKGGSNRSRLKNDR